MDEKETPENANNQSVGMKITGKKFGCCKCLFWTFSVVVAVMAIFVGYIYVRTREFEIPQELMEHLGPEGVQLFMAYDRDSDGYLSIHEFESLYHRFAGSGANVSLGADTIYEQPINDDDNVVTVVANFQPLLLETMTREKDEDGWAFYFVEKVKKMAYDLDTVQGLKDWKSLNHEWMNCAVRQFAVFLPPTYHSLATVYHIIEDDDGLMGMFQGDISSNRYFPPFVDDVKVIIHRLLSMFHPRPFIMSRFRPRGSVAIIRARNDDYIDIVFRIHAEFQLNEPPYHPFWFTPGQFTGNLIVSRDYKHIVHFNLYVPTTHKLNVDMEWLEGAKNMVVDIGFMPEMSLRVTSPSIPASNINISEKIADAPFSVEEIVWLEKITQEEALRQLEVELYPFKKVQYYNFTESFSLAHKEEKLVHTILLWGALDDQSC